MGRLVHDRRLRPVRRDDRARAVPRVEHERNAPLLQRQRDGLHLLVAEPDIEDGGGKRLAAGKVAGGAHRGCRSDDRGAGGSELQLQVQRQQRLVLDDEYPQSRKVKVSHDH